MSKFNIVCNETHYDKDSDSLVTKRRPEKPTISIVGGVSRTI